jgi:hypothetical protein
MRVNIDESPRDRALVKTWGQRLTRLRHLYHYASLEGEDRFTWFEDLVLRSKVFCRRFDQVNDPFDGEVLPNFDATPEEVRAYWEQHVIKRGLALADERANIEHLVTNYMDEGTMRVGWDAQRELIQKLGIVCFSEPRDDVPMWAYYAGGHRGVCVRFRTTALMQWQGAGMPPFRVEYEREYPKCGFYQSSGFQRTRAMLAVKARVWKHEREWRAVFDEGGKHFHFTPDALDGIVLGCRIEPQMEERVRAVLKRRTPAVDLFKARRAERKYSLVIEPA